MEPNGKLEKQVKKALLSLMKPAWKEGEIYGRDWLGRVCKHNETYFITNGHYIFYGDILPTLFPEFKIVTQDFPASVENYFKPSKPSNTTAFSQVPLKPMFSRGAFIGVFNTTLCGIVVNELCLGDTSKDPSRIGFSLTYINALAAMGFSEIHWETNDGVAETYLKPLDLTCKLMPSRY